MAGDAVNSTRMWRFGVGFNATTARPARTTRAIGFSSTEEPHRCSEPSPWDPREARPILRSGGNLVAVIGMECVPLTSVHRDEQPFPLQVSAASVFRSPDRLTDLMRVSIQRCVVVAAKTISHVACRRALNLEQIAGLAGQACDNKKHIRHETPQHVNSFQTTYLLNTAVTANCCAVQQKCVNGASARPGFPAAAARRTR